MDAMAPQVTFCHGPIHSSGLVRKRVNNRKSLLNRRLRKLAHLTCVAGDRARDLPARLKHRLVGGLRTVAYAHWPSSEKR